MSTPEPPPATVVSEARAALYEGLQLAMADVGWSGRADQLPPRQPVAPCAWVDVPTMHQAPTENARAVAVTFPVVFVVDGADQRQVEQVDALLAHGWWRLEAAATKWGVTVQTAGPEDVDVGGAVLRGLVFRCQTTVLTRTLCQQSLVQS